MEILGVPGRYFAANLLFTLVLTSIFFFPAISSFGKVLLGTEDMQFFIWLFHHFETSLDSGSNPLYANEIYYPYGISLAISTITPLQSFIYYLLPSSWGVFGKITFLQIVSYALGGIFSFCLVYRFTKAFFPSLIGMIIFNFSVYHFEKAVHHLNYGMAFPFLALFFFFYFDFIDKPRDRKNLTLLSVSLLLLALTETTAALMAGFIVFLDIIIRYFSFSGVKISPKKILILALGVGLSFIANIIAAASSLNSFFIYIFPPAFFIGACFLSLGPEKALKCERESRYLISLLLISIPTLLYISFLFIQPGYDYIQDNAIFTRLAYIIPLEYAVLPSDLQAVAHLDDFHGLRADSESGIYIGLLALLFLAFSFISRKVTKEEKYFRNFFLLSLLFSFPILRIGDTFFGTLFTFVTPLFPGLAVLRVQARFMLFGLLFLSILVGLVVQRLIDFKTIRGKLLTLLMVAILMFEYWPATSSFEFDPQVSAFYSSLARESADLKIFLYPNADYYSLLNEVYAQTIHHKKLSEGVVSRFPTGPYDLYSMYYFMGKFSPSEVLETAKRLDFDYLVVQKKTCYNECFYGTFTPIEPSMLQNITLAVEKELGKPVFEDDSRIIYTLMGNVSG